MIQKSFSSATKRFAILLLVGLFLFTGASTQALAGKKYYKYALPGTGSIHINRDFSKKRFYISSNSSILSIRNGRITGKKPGFATIFYHEDGKSHKKAILLAGLLAKHSHMIPGQEQTILAFAISPENIMQWSSSNPSILSVDTFGKVAAKKEGQATIICQTNDGRQYKTNIDVISQESSQHLQKEEVSAILTSNESTLLMKSGDTHLIRISFQGKYGTSLGKSLTWESSDPQVASVNDRGNVTANSDGSCIIKCTSSDSSLSFSVNVISDGESGKSCTLNLLSGHDGKKKTYHLFKQNAHNYDSYDNYLAWHGCAHCSLATVLGAYNTNYAGILPNEIISGIEKEHAPEDEWRREHEKHSLRYQMPLSLHGISQLLQYGNVNNDYIPSFQYDQAKTDILNHLRTGNPVIIEVRQRSSKTKKTSQRWTNSYHTMVFLGAYTDGIHILLCDSVDRSWYDGGQRYKIVTIDDVMEYMFSSTKTCTSYYYDGAESDGGYIKIYDQ